MTEKKRRITFHFPTTTPVEKDGKTEWVEASTRLGSVLPDGTIEGTPYKFKRRKIKGGVAFTRHTRLADPGDGTRVNPASGEVFTRTKKGTGWFGRSSRVFAPNEYLDTEVDDD